MSLRHVLVVTVCVLAVAAGLAAYMATQEPGPHLTIHGPAVIGSGAFTVDLSIEAARDELASLEVWAEQGGRRFPIIAAGTAAAAQLTQETPDRVRVTLDVVTATLEGLRDGSARLAATAERRLLFGLAKAQTVEGVDVAVRISPPSLRVVSSHHHVRLGGAELVVYRVNPPDAESGVVVGDRFYRGYPAKGVAGGRTIDPAVHMAFFALPFDQDVNTPIRLRARDAAGNTTVADFPHDTFSTTFTSSRVAVDDRFLARAIPPIVANTPGLDLPVRTAAERIAALQVISRDVRQQNDDRLAAIAEQTSADWLAHGPFRRLAGASRAPFAEHRTYVVGRREIDQQVHLGFDLASTRGAAVPASNTGRVLWAAYLGIHGNCVILDHGMGVQTLYGHLSVMDVEVGDRVEKGEIIGRSGATGLAAGDHVHFTVLVSGTPVTPLEWWDARWVRDRIDRKLAEGGIR